MRPDHPWLHRVALVGALAVVGCGDGEVPDAPTAALSVEPAFLEMGSVPRGQRTTGSWTLVNVAEEPVPVLRIGPLPCSCGHAVLRLPSRPSGADRIPVDGQLVDLVLAPGEQSVLEFTFDSSRYRQPISRKVVSIPIVLRDHPSLVVECGVDVWTPFVVEPWAIQLGEVGVREQAEGFVLVAAHDDAQFGVQIDTEVDGWRVVSERVSSDGSPRVSYRIQVNAPRELPEGPFQQEFLFRTDLSGAPPIRFFAQGIAVPDLSISPRRVVFDPSADRAVAELRVWHRAEGAVLGKLELVDAGGPLELLEEVDEAPNKRLLRLRWTGDVPESLESGTMILETSDAETPRLEIPWAVMPARG